MNIFEIQKKIDDILNEAIENEGNVDETRISELDIAQEELGDKLYAYAFVCDRYDSDIALLKQYKQALDDRIKSCTNKKNKLKQILANVVWKYGDAVTKKGEPTGAYSIKFPNITLTVKKIFDVEYDKDTVNQYLQQCKEAIVCDSDSEIFNNLMKFGKVTIDTKFKPNKANGIIKLLNSHNIQIDESEINIEYTKTDLIDALNENPDGLDAWELVEKDSITIRK